MENTSLTWEVWHEGDKHSPTVHVLYLFAGVERKADVQHYLVEWAKRDNVCLKGLQLDILRNEGHNLHKEEVWNWVLQQLHSGLVDFLLVAPPCNTHSRARCQYRQYGGPRPLRDFSFPHGFPWLSEDNKQKVALADELVQKSLQGCRIVKEQNGHFFLEHPEQLGLTAGKSQPAFGIFQKWPNCCVKKASAPLQFSNVIFLHRLLNQRVFSLRWIYAKLGIKVCIDWMRKVGIWDLYLNNALMGLTHTRHWWGKMNRAVG